MAHRGHKHTDGFQSVYDKPKEDNESFYFPVIHRSQILLGHNERKHTDGAQRSKDNPQEGNEPLHLPTIRSSKEDKCMYAEVEVHEEEDRYIVLSGDTAARTDGSKNTSLVKSPTQTVSIDPPIIQRPEQECRHTYVNVGVSEDEEGCVTFSSLKADKKGCSEDEHQYDTLNSLTAHKEGGSEDEDRQVTLTAD